MINRQELPAVILPSNELPTAVPEFFRLVSPSYQI